MTIFSKSKPQKNRDLDGRVRVDPYYHNILIDYKNHTGISIKVLLEKALIYARNHPEEVWGLKK